MHVGNKVIFDTVGRYGMEYSVLCVWGGGGGGIVD